MERSLDSLLTWLNLVDIHDVITAGLHESLTSVVNRTHEIGAAIHRTYFDVRHQPPLPAEMPEPIRQEQRQT